MVITGTDLKLPEAATTALNMQNQINQSQTPYQGAPPAVPPQNIAPPIATQCFMLSNMFDPAQ